MSLDLWCPPSLWSQWFIYKLFLLLFFKFCTIAALQGLTLCETRARGWPGPCRHPVPNYGYTYGRLSEIHAEHLQQEQVQSLFSPARGAQCRCLGMQSGELGVYIDFSFLRSASIFFLLLLFVFDICVLFFINSFSLSHTLSRTYESAPHSNGSSWAWLRCLLRSVYPHWVSYTFSPAVYSEWPNQPVSRVAWVLLLERSIDRSSVDSNLYLS